MDETAYWEILSITGDRQCPFEKAILTSCVACSKVEKHNIAEREVVACSHTPSLQSCIELRDLFRHNFIFALGLTHIDGPLAHAQELRLQCGGLRGLLAVLDDIQEVEDVAALVLDAQKRFGQLGDIPFAHIVQTAVHYKVR